MHIYCIGDHCAILHMLSAVVVGDVVMDVDVCVSVSPVDCRSIKGNLTRKWAVSPPNSVEIPLRFPFLIPHIELSGQSDVYLSFCVITI